MDSDSAFVHHRQGSWDRHHRSEHRGWRHSQHRLWQPGGLHHLGSRELPGVHVDCQRGDDAGRAVDRGLGDARRRRLSRRQQQALLRVARRDLEPDRGGPIGGGAAQSFGSSPAAVAAIGSDTLVAFVGSDGDLYDQTRTGGAWGAASSHTLGNTLALMPALIAPTSGPSLMIAYVRSTDAKILFTTRTGSSWTTPSLIDANSFTADPVALTALPNGEALLAFRGLDNAIYFSRYTPAGSPVSSPPAPFAVPNVTSPSRPALAAGVGGVDAEMAFINALDGKAYHARLTGTSWSVPVMVGGTQLTTVTIASAP